MCIYLSLLFLNHFLGFWTIHIICFFSPLPHNYGEGSLEADLRGGWTRLAGTRTPGNGGDIRTPIVPHYNGKYLGMSRAECDELLAKGAGFPQDCLLQRRLSLQPLDVCWVSAVPVSVLSVVSPQVPTSTELTERAQSEPFWNTHLAKALSGPGHSSGSHYPRMEPTVLQQVQQTLPAHSPACLLLRTHLSPHWDSIPDSAAPRKPLHFLLQGMGYPSSLCGKPGAPRGRL